MITDSRQARRWRERQKTKPVRQKAKRRPTTRFLLMCRIEDPAGSGAWAIVGVETPAEGDVVARELQSQVAGMPEVVPARCELVENNDAALQRWGAASVQRRDALRRWGETEAA